MERICGNCSFFAAAAPATVGICSIDDCNSCRRHPLETCQHFEPADTLSFAKEADDERDMEKD